MDVLSFLPEERVWGHPVHKEVSFVCLILLLIGCSSWIIVRSSFDSLWQWLWVWCYFGGGVSY